MRPLLICCQTFSFVACHGAAPIGLNTSTNDSDARGALSKAMKSMLAAKSYRARVESSTSNGTTSKTTIEFVVAGSFSPDTRSHYTRACRDQTRDNRGG